MEKKTLFFFVSFLFLRAAWSRRHSNEFTTSLRRVAKILSERAGLHGAETWYVGFFVLFFFSVFCGAQRRAVASSHGALRCSVHRIDVSATRRWHRFPN